MIYLHGCTHTQLVAKQCSLTFIGPQIQNANKHNNKLVWGETRKNLQPTH